jgi:hypothetical protein
VVLLITRIIRNGFGSRHVSPRQYSSFVFLVRGFEKYQNPMKWLWRCDVLDQWCGGIRGKYNDKSHAMLTLEINMSHQSLFHLCRLIKGM